MLSTIQLPCDLCVIGGGISGMAAAISAAREGLDVILMHERPVLGGNASSEIRMWISGARGRNNRETGIVEEIELENMYRNPTKSFAIWDTVLFDFMRRDELVALAAGAWDYVKNSGNFNAKNWDLDYWASCPASGNPEECAANI